MYIDTVTQIITLTTQHFIHLYICISFHLAPLPLHSIFTTSKNILLNNIQFFSNPPAFPFLQPTLSIFPFDRLYNRLSHVSMVSKESLGVYTHTTCSTSMLSRESFKWGIYTYFRDT